MSIFVGHFSLLDPDLATQINADPDTDPDPQPWLPYFRLEAGHSGCVPCVELVERILGN
jgi:hypothetical protein